MGYFCEPFVVYITFADTAEAGSYQHSARDADSIEGSSVKRGTIQRILTWPLRKDDTHESRLEQ